MVTFNYITIVVNFMILSLFDLEGGYLISLPFTSTDIVRKRERGGPPAADTEKYQRVPLAT